ncbi:UDP-3-O-acyl-N-acetylglucosamine deacetylase [Agaribacterium sp. ZY112]|uniref:UDP-3-O-acyl-N-acetylglucosamine deacetylase n=1 Tax=Agaribacterium sp. ZY112 TaxID=3233574 RepID=UPI0035250D70
MHQSYFDTGLSFYQHTLADSFHCLGRGLHTGLKVAMTVQPGDENSGYIFRRRDVLHGNPEIAARWYNVGETNLSTTIMNKMGVRVSTIEHLLAALRGCGIDNAYITLDGPEVPILDGSALPFVRQIRQVGLVKQSAQRRALLVQKPVFVADGKSSVSLIPSALPRVRVDIDFEHAAIGCQSKQVTVAGRLFEHKLAGARAFGFEEDVAALRKLGFARGGSLSNAVVVGKDKVLNEEGLRYKDEFVRHKCLDAVGDMALAGPHIIASYHGRRSGHRLNNLVLRSLMGEAGAAENLSMKEAMQWWQAQKGESIRV